VKDHSLGNGDLIKIGPVVLKFLRGGIEAQYHEQIYQIVVTDGLTGASTRRYFDEFLEREISRARRRARPLSLVMFDLDHFKKVNDAYSHLAGDYVLREIASMIRPMVRPEECFARYGGDEFALILPDGSREEAVTFAEKIRALFEQHRILFDGHVIAVTLSLGVAEFSPEMSSPRELIRAADAKLYEAKRGGRNRVQS
jgi:diguanylate cyclase (GGDEF)-like protein